MNMLRVTYLVHAFFSINYFFVCLFKHLGINCRVMNSIEDLYGLGELLKDFVTQKDFKRKPSDGEFLTPLSKRPRTIHSHDYSAYLSRISSYSSVCWNHPSCSNFNAPLSPLQLARYGWIAVEGEGRLVRCESCRENLYLALPLVTSPSFQSMLDKQGSRVATGHLEFCPWGVSPSPNSWIFVTKSKEEILENALGLSELGPELPCIAKDISKTFSGAVEWIVKEFGRLREIKRDRKRSRRKSKDIELNSKVRRSAAFLAVTGWQKGKLDNTIVDNLKARKVGCWNFVSLQDEMDRIESSKVFCELAGNDSLKIPEKEFEKRYFDPLKEHHSWNPIILRDEHGAMGWENVVDMFLPTMGCVNTTKAQQDEVEINADSKSSVKNSISPNKAADALQKVRSLMSDW